MLIVTSYFKAYNNIVQKGEFFMKKIHLNSPEFNRVMKNLQLENLSLSPILQQKVLELVNAQTPLTPNIIKEALKHGQIQ